MGSEAKNKEQPRGTWVLKNGNKPLNLRSLPRCEARAKSTGKRCGNPAMKGKRVCYIHGGRSPGAPKGNKNAHKHGRNSTDAIEKRRRIRKLLRMTEALIQSET